MKLKMETSCPPHPLASRSFLALYSSRKISCKHILPRNISAKGPERRPKIDLLFFVPFRRSFERALLRNRDRLSWNDAGVCNNLYLFLCFR